MACAINGRPLHRMYTELDDLLIAIDDVPTIDPERKGTWINEGRFANYHGGNVYRCSKCGCRIIEREPDDFCKYCGSDNRKGEQE